MEWLGHRQASPLPPGAQVFRFPLPPGKQPLRAVLHRPEPWPIRLNDAVAQVDGGVTALAGAQQLQPQGLAEVIKPVAEVKGAGQVTGDHRIKAVGDQQVAAGTHRIHHRRQQGQRVCDVFEHIGAHQHVDALAGEVWYKADVGERLAAFDPVARRVGLADADLRLGQGCSQKAGERTEATAEIEHSLRCQGGNSGGDLLAMAHRDGVLLDEHPVQEPDWVSVENSQPPRVGITVVAATMLPSLIHQLPDLF